MKIPPHIAWPLIIVSLLVGGAATSLSIVFFAQSDGGVQLVPEYQQRNSSVEARPSPSAKPDSPLSEEALQQPSSAPDTEHHPDSDSLPGNR